MNQEDKMYALYKNGEVVSEWDYIDMVTYSRDAEDIIFRARMGDDWFVVKNGVDLSQSWDYLDNLLVSRFTDTYSYRARDVDGDWHMAINNESLALPSEPSRIYLNEMANEPFAFYELDEERSLPHSGNFVITKISSALGDWTYPEPVRFESVDNDGNMLFMSRTELPASVRSGGNTIEIRNFFNWQEDKVYWMNDQKIGSGVLRIYFVYDETVEKTRNSQYPDNASSGVLGGVLQGVYFDEPGNAVFYVALGGKLIREVYDVSSYRVFGDSMVPDSK
ncbi:MAG: hypothetical protein HOC71_18360 [Candidatus Latescibacteria bacterium]|nr:hypothetical protein [Candidatus Latescibacterota bacterium]